MEILWKLFGYRPVDPVTGTAELNQWQFSGDEDGYVADAVTEELGERGYRVTHAERVEPERDRSRRRR